MVERLQKILSRYGVASRRGAEQVILAGRVCLNGTPVTELGIKADPQCDRITIDGIPLQTAPPTSQYLLLHKPVGYLCTRHDPQARQTIQDLLPQAYQHLYSIGRLDFDSSGALLLTNDGELANQLTHPKYHVSKIYIVQVTGHPSDRTLQQWRQGIELDGKLTLPATVEAIATSRSSTHLQIELHEGRNRQIRRVAQLLGHRVLTLHRSTIGGISLGQLDLGLYRSLDISEIEQLCQPRLTNFP